MSTICNEIIRASAGTGKTFALSDRIVRLLLLGAEPDSIVALTFTRKAATEFVSSVFRKLADAAEDGTHARELARRLSIEVSPAACASTLARMIRCMDRLQFGTLDAFFQRIVNSIPFELGLAGPVQLLEERTADATREQELERLVRGDMADDESREAMLEAFRQATWGAEEKQLLPRLLRFIDRCRELYLQAPDADQWGKAEFIWPEGCPCLPPPADIAGPLSTLQEWTESLDGRFGDALRKFVESIAEWQPGMSLPTDTIAKQLFSKLSESSCAEPLTLTYYKKSYDLPVHVATALRDVVRYVLGRCLSVALDVAAGMHHLLKVHDRLHRARFLRTARLSFSDVTELLRSADTILWQERLDSRLDHWLFDEFQDTSVAQWSVLANLVEEVLQDPSGSRSVFFVGDAKQSIYRWRGGEHRLLNALEDGFEKAFKIRSLDHSFRSAPPIIELINRFGEAAKQSAGRLPETTITDWARVWHPHTSAVESARGHASVRIVPDLPSMADEMLQILKTVRPLERGLTCAILTRDNAEATAIARLLRERGFLDIAAETDVSVATDHPFGRTFLALISAIAHPADIVSRRIVEMTPLFEVVTSHGGWRGMRRLVLALLAQRGWEGTLEEIITQTPRLPEGEFAHLRREQLFEIARKLDADGSRNPDDFLRIARDTTRRDAASAGRVQVMTIHKAKGLGFDLVLLSISDKTRMDATDNSPLLVARASNRLPRWLIGRPPSIVQESDATLCKAQQEDRADAAYESLCVYYVALTRAKYGLHVFLPETKEKSNSSHSPVSLLHAAVSDGDPGPTSIVWQTGDPEWFTTHDPSEATPPAEAPPPADWSQFPIRKQPTLMNPSRHTTPGRTPIFLREPSARSLGTEVHQAFAAIEWLDDPTSAKTLEQDSEAMEVVRSCLRDDSIARLFQQPEGLIGLWRERAFDVLVSERWISGVFDRVILSERETVLIDFKTDNDSPENVRTRHAAQMDAYLEALTALGVKHPVRAVIVHTPTRSVLDFAQK